MNNNLLIVGTVAFDDIEAPSGESGKVLGGAATYIGLAASQLNVPSAIVSVVGSDFPQRYLDLFKSKNINIDGLKLDKEGKTFYWKGRYHKNLNKRDTLDTQLNVLESFQPKVPESFQEASVVMLGNLHPMVQNRVIDQLAEGPKTILLDTMNFWMDHELEELIKVIERVQIITINDEEAYQLTAATTLVDAARRIHKMGPEYVVIKKGEHGALLFSNDYCFFAPALPMDNVIDPTGAGDSFAGGLAGYLAQQGHVNMETVKSGIICGSALASFCVTAFGTRALKNITKDGFQDRLETFKKLTTYSL